MEIKHQLYTSEDFKHMSGQEMEESWVARMVLEGGLSICKICGEGEAGLDNPCKPKIVAYEDYLKAMEKATEVFGQDPAYYGEEGAEEVHKQMLKLGYTEEELNKSRER